MVQGLKLSTNPHNYIFINVQKCHPSHDIEHYKIRHFKQHSMFSHIVTIAIEKETNNFVAIIC